MNCHQFDSSFLFLAAQFQEEIDFEVDDALAKLNRLGIATYTNDVWTAKKPTELIAPLLAQWNALAQ